MSRSSPSRIFPSCSLLIYSPYIRLYSICVSWPNDRRPSFCRSLQRLSAEHPGTCRDYAGLLDHCRLSSLRNETSRSTRGHFPRSTFARAVGKIHPGHKPAVIHGRDEAGHSARGTEIPKRRQPKNRSPNWRKPANRDLEDADGLAPSAQLRASPTAQRRATHEHEHRD